MICIWVNHSGSTHHVPAVAASPPGESVLQAPGQWGFRTRVLANQEARSETRWAVETEEKQEVIREY